MTRAIIWLFTAISFLIRALPSKLRYAFSDVIAFLLRRVVRYRRMVVRKNLQLSFPEKTTDELRAIEKKFYRNLADLFTEALCLLSISPRKLTQLMQMKNKALIDNALSQGKRVFLAIGHCGNWEWFGAYLSLVFPGQAGSFYKQQRSRVFDALFYHMRSRLGGLKLLESKTAYRKLASGDSKVRVMIIPGDQTPGGKSSDHWTTFMHQETPFFTGMEKMAQSLGFEVFYVDLLRTERGNYLAVVEELRPVDDPEKTNPLTEAYARRLEHSLLQSPDNWLWSHRRWKHKRKSASK
ncbi:MAG: lysophospholipid acyltransferase family protein [Bacteroidetes bacterium]|nr:lysophospholipid acyltransferase family protein [Bacteroidota bacterium]